MTVVLFGIAQVLEALVIGLVLFFYLRKKKKGK